MNIATIRASRLPLIEVARALTPPAIWGALYRRLVVGDIPDADQYKPHFSPWRAPWFQDLYRRIAPNTLVSPDRCWTLWLGVTQALNVEGDLAEAGVFQGGTARLLLEAMGSRDDKSLLLFDSFEGMKSVSAENDRHGRGDFGDTSLEHVMGVVGNDSRVKALKGWIPDTFAGLEDRTFAFVHIDLDLYQGIIDTLRFVYPRLSRGGIIVFDDYGFASCPGARKAVDEFFADKKEKPLALSTSQALVHKL